MLTRRNWLWGLGAASFGGCTCDDHPPRVSPKQSPEQRRSAPHLRRADAHLHIGRGAVARALALMDAEGIAWGVNLSGGQVGHGLEKQLEQAKAASGRLLTFTSPRWQECAQDGYGARLADQLRRAVDLGARGLKIHKALGLEVQGPDGKLVGVDAPELDALFHTAGELGVPVWIHTGDPLVFWKAPDQSNERYAELSAHPDWGLFGKAVPSFDELYAQLERRVARHAQTTFVAVHFGNCAEQPGRVARSLRRHSNLWIDTAARIPELGRHAPEMVHEFFTEFQDRILFGSDLGVGPEPKPLFLGSSGSQPATDAERRLFFDATRRYFETRDTAFAHPTPIQGDWTISGIGLPEPILEKLYVGNATRLLAPKLAPT